MNDLTARRKLNIAIVSDFSYPYTKGGVESRYFVLAKYLLSQGHHVTWFTSRQWNGSSEQVVEGIRVYCISKRLQPFSGSRRSIIEAIQFGLAAFHLLWVRERFDVMDMSQFPLFHLFAGNLYAWSRQTPVVESWYEFWDDHWLKYLGQMGRMGRLIEKILARFHNHKIVISKITFDRLVAAGCNPHLLHYVPNWIDYEHILNIMPLGKPFDVCYFGRLKDHKNIDMLLRAIALCGNEGLVLQTKILGDGPERQRLEQLTQDLQLGSQVEFGGQIEQHDDLLGYVKSARLVVIPSTKDSGGSITALEANACGVPVLAIQCPLGLDESLISEDRNGYWAKEADPRSLADRIRHHFRKSQVEQERMRVSALEQASNYKVESLCRQVESIYLGAS
jgi:glycosyltransferase involved in cell wall biosynthesis